jgi:hypothetical protein
LFFYFFSWGLKMGTNRKRGFALKETQDNIF